MTYRELLAAVEEATRRNENLEYLTERRERDHLTKDQKEALDSLISLANSRLDEEIKLEIKSPQTT